MHFQGPFPSSGDGVHTGSLASYPSHELSYSSNTGASHHEQKLADDRSLKYIVPAIVINIETVASACKARIETLLSRHCPKTLNSCLFLR